MTGDRCRINCVYTNMQVWGVVLLLSVAVSGHVSCGVTSSWEEEHYTAVHASRRLQSDFVPIRNDTYAPLRMTAFYELSAFNSSIQSLIESVYLPGAMKWFSQILSVKSLLNGLKVNKEYCGSNVKVPYPHQILGVRTDLILYVIAKTYEGETWLTRAGACYFDPVTGVPLAGVIEYNTQGTWEDVPTNIALHRHSLAHILGFSYNLFMDFTIRDIPYTMPIFLAKVRNKVATFLATPEVKKEGIAAFGYQGLDGIELEDQGGPGTHLSHWEKRIMMNDFMTASISTDTIYSRISLAVFKDSGWYQVNDSYGDPVGYGAGAGYGYFFSNCIVAGTPLFSGFCSDVDHTHYCSRYHTHKAYCNVKNYNYSLDFTYFSNSVTGGADMFSDYCPYFVPFANGDCRNTGSVPTFLNTEKYGEIVGADSMCFTGTYQTVNTPGSEALHPHSGCHKVTCNANDGALVEFSDGKQVRCPLTGGSVSIAGYIGDFICPDYATLCSSRPCVNSCYGNGVCAQGNCICDAGYTGGDCSLRCHSSCSTCSNESNSGCLVCSEGKTLQGTPPSACV